MTTFRKPTANKRSDSTTKGQTARPQAQRNTQRNSNSNSKNSVSRPTRLSAPKMKPATVRPQNSDTETKKSEKIVGEKLQKILARAGKGSRREIEDVIAQGRVSVDGKMATLGDRVQISSSTKIRIDGHLVNLTTPQKEICRVLMYYKPEGELCTRADPEGRATVFDRLPRL